MNRLLLLPLLVILSIGPAAAQQFDASATNTIKGSFFVREILISGQTATQQITAASSAIGIVAFDGQGNYSFTGQGATSASGPNANLTAKGVYKVAGNGMFAMTSLLSSDIAFGGTSALGPSAFVASATEGTNVDIIVGVPVGANATAATLKGAYSAGYIDFLNADATQVRQATFSATADGAGGLGNLTVGGKMAASGGSAVSQTVPGVAYTLTANGSGTVNFGAASSAQLISGTKNLYVSQDGNIVIGGSPTGFDLLVALKSFSGTASSASFTGEYYTGALEESISTAAQGGSVIDGFYGAINSTGAGIAISHNRFQSFAQPVFDYTFSNPYSMNSNGTFTPSDIPYQFALGNNGSAFIATGTGSLYSLMVGFGTPAYSPSGVWINPLGVVNAANFAPITNPVGPNELVTIFGSGLAASLTAATNLPLPVTLGNVQVTVNGTPAPIFYVSPTQIAFLIPSAVSPANGTFYATITVLNNGKPSNAVTVYTANTAPGVISIASDGIGPAAAQHANYTLINSASPALAGETIQVYAVGLGAVNPPVSDGAAASTTTLSQTTNPVGVNVDGLSANIAFSGLTPGTSGLYQVNLAVPPATASGTPYIDIATADAYTSEASLNVQGTGLDRPASRKRPALTGHAVKSKGRPLE